ncbi:MAG: hypothetical protein HQL52_04170 [Magnetococcales bacterium]|nr:hypothetical protein [Magnetococcales bacterium]
MDDRRLERSMACDLPVKVELTLEGPHTTHGTLSAISHSTAWLTVPGEYPLDKRCFLRFFIEEEAFYSRGTITESSETGVVVHMENGLPIFREVARLNIFAKQHTLKKLLHAKKVNLLLDHAEVYHDKNRKANCWEITECGKEFACIAGTDTRYDGLLGGKNGGRFCAFIEGTLCKDGVPLTSEKKLEKCLNCKIYYEIINDNFPSIS